MITILGRLSTDVLVFPGLLHEANKQINPQKTNRDRENEFGIKRVLILWQRETYNTLLYESPLLVVNFSRSPKPRRVQVERKILQLLPP